jgi:cell division protein ZapA
MAARQSTKKATKKTEEMETNQQENAQAAPAPQDSVAVEIYDQTYRLRGVNAEHVRALAATVDAKMRAVAARSSTVDSLRVAVLAALNLADELALLKERQEPKANSSVASSVSKRTDELSDLLDSVLAG